MSTISNVKDGVEADRVGSSRPLVFLFPGLGDHYLGMGRDLYEQEAVFRRWVDECAERLRPELDADLRELLYPAGAEAEAPKALDLRQLLGRPSLGAAPRSPAQRALDRTSVAQPALFVVEYALAQLWMSWGLRPTMMLGYSLGEYVAACLAEVLPLDEMLTLVARRARLIEGLPAGAMLAVTLSEAELIEQLDERLSISAVNGPKLCVVAGPPEAVDALAQTLAQRKVDIRRIQTSHAFHSKMMQPIAAQVTELAAGYRYFAPRIPYVSNVTGELISAAQACDPGYWAQHLCRPVRAHAGLGVVLEDPRRALLEVGPGQTLTSLALGHASTTTTATTSAGPRVVVASMRHSLAPGDDREFAYRALSKLRAAGAEIDAARCPLVDDSPAAAGEARESGAWTETERALAGIWAKLLGCEVDEPAQGFFELGGNSLLATRLSYKIGKRFGVKLSLRRIYECASLSALAAEIDGQGGHERERAGNPTAASPTPARPRYRLPNGLEITHQNPGETRHFYDDIFAHRSYLRHGVSLPEGAVVFDVGANIGMFSLFTHHEGRGAEIYAFEPAPPLFEILSRNVTEHGVRARLFNYGLSDSEREAEFTFYPRSSGMSSFHADEADERHVLSTIIGNQRAAGETELADLDAHANELLDVRLEAQTLRARLRRMSDVIREQGIERVDLLKVDVQRCEHEVIAGIDEDDWPKIRQVALEVHDIDGRVAELSALFERRGFSVTAIQDELYVGTNIHNIYAVRS